MNSPACSHRRHSRAGHADNCPRRGARERRVRGLAEAFPDAADAAAPGGEEQRRRARAALDQLSQILRRVGDHAASGRYDAAAAEYEAYRKLSVGEAAEVLHAAEPRSAFATATRQEPESQAR